MENIERYNKVYDKVIAAYTEQKRLDYDALLNPETPAETIEAIVETFKGNKTKMYMALAEHPHAPSHLLVDIIKHWKEGVNDDLCRAVLRNPNLHLEDLLPGDKDAYMHYDTCRKTTQCLLSLMDVPPLEFMNKLFEVSVIGPKYQLRGNKYWDKFIDIAKDNTTSSSILEELSTINLHELDYHIVRHPNVTEKLFHRYACHESSEIRYLCAARKDAPLDVLRKLACDEDFTVRQGACSHEKFVDYINARLENMQDCSSKCRYDVYYDDEYDDEEDYPLFAFVEGEREIRYTPSFIDDATKVNLCPGGVDITIDLEKCRIVPDELVKTVNNALKRMDPNNKRTFEYDGKGYRFVYNGIVRKADFDGFNKGINIYSSKNERERIGFFDIRKGQMKDLRNIVRKTVGKKV